jgi:hypothetical protein
MNTPTDNHAKQLVLVTGGTGTLGRLVVPRLQAAGPAVGSDCPPAGYMHSVNNKPIASFGRPAY